MKYYFTLRKDKEMYETTVIDSKEKDMDVKKFEIHKSLLLGSSTTLDAIGYKRTLPDLFEADCALKEAISNYGKMKRSTKLRRTNIMAKYFYVYVENGSTDRIVRMYNTEAVKDGKIYTAMVDKVVPAANIEGFVDGIKASGYFCNKELAETETREIDAKRVLAEKMTAYHEARDDYSEAADALKKCKAKYGIA